MNERMPKDEPEVADTQPQTGAGRARGTKPKRGPDEVEEGGERSSLGSPRTTDAPPRQIGDRAAASSWETDGGSGT
jgi:hypothetical protein